MSEKAFFTSIRRSLFGGKLRQSQVNGIRATLKSCARHGVSNRRQRAYILATDYWETGKTMRSDIREIGRGRGKPYGIPDPVTGHIYYGRSKPQLTWKSNYARMGKKMGIDLVNNPDLVLRGNVGADLLVIGMRDGDYDTRNGVPLRYYLNPQKADWLNARRTVNIMDKASEIASIARKFDMALSLSPIPTGAPVTIKGLIPVLIAFVATALFIILKITGVL